MEPLAQSTYRIEYRLFASPFFVQPFSPPAANGMCIPVPKDVAKETYCDLNASLRYRTLGRIGIVAKNSRVDYRACSDSFSLELTEKECSSEMVELLE